MSSDDVELDRRGFLKVSGMTATIFALSGGTALAQTQRPADFDNVALLIGPQSNRPDPDGSFFANKTRYHYIYWDTATGSKWEIEEDDSSWSVLPGSRQRLIDAVTSDVVVSNTTTETTVFDPMVGANQMLVGDVYKIPIMRMRMMKTLKGETEVLQQKHISKDLESVA